MPAFVGRHWKDPGWIQVYETMYAYGLRDVFHTVYKMVDPPPPPPRALGINESQTTRWFKCSYCDQLMHASTAMSGMCLFCFQMGRAYSRETRLFHPSTACMTFVSGEMHGKRVPPGWIGNHRVRVYLSQEEYSKSLKKNDGFCTSCGRCHDDG